MRLVLILTLLVALPALMLAHRNYFLNHDQSVLLVKVRAALDEPQFANVDRDRISMNHMDVALYGFVETPELREAARARVSAVHGVRCRPDDNHLQIPAHLNAKMKNNTLALEGWLPSEATLNDVTQWLEGSRPGLQVDTAGIKLSPCVTHTEAPSGSEVPAVFSECWNAIRDKATLHVERTEATLHVSGTLPSTGLRDSVMVALSDGEGGTRVEADELKAGSYVKAARFTDAVALPAFLKEFFQAPTAEMFEADDADVLRVRAIGTPEMEARWRELLLPLADRTAVAADFQIFPTVYHFPGYAPTSKLPPPTIASLREALKPAVFHFDPNNFYLQAAEVPKFNVASLAIAAAGHDARVIVGGYVDADGDAKVNQANAVKRCETIIAEFKDRGLPTAQFEMTIYSPAAVPNGADNRRVVELLLK